MKNFQKSFELIQVMSFVFFLKIFPGKPQCEIFDPYLTEVDATKQGNK